MVLSSEGRSSRLRIGYLSKFPPSPIGIAHYAIAFEKVLARMGEVERLETSAAPNETQRLRTVIAACIRVTTRRSNIDALQVELSGRAIAEFYGALCWLVVRRRRAPLWITIHDAPELVGGLFFVTAFDRRGFRRVASALSQTVGIRLERYLLRRASQVICLSELGSTAVATRLRVPRPKVIPHAVDLGPKRVAARRDRVLVFCPGYVAPADVEPVLDALSDGTDADVVVGACSSEAERKIAACARELGVDGRLSFTGVVEDFAALRSFFANADVVVRLRMAPGRPANWAAVSGPIILAMAHGCAIITNDTRGIERELRATTAALLVESRDDAVATIRRVLADPELCFAVGSRAYQVAANQHVPERVVRALRE